jgi:hypothetical protein
MNLITQLGWKKTTIGGERFLFGPIASSFAFLVMVEYGKSSVRPPPLWKQNSVCKNEWKIIKYSFLAWESRLYPATSKKHVDKIERHKMS